MHVPLVYLLLLLDQFPYLWLCFMALRTNLNDSLSETSRFSESYALVQEQSAQISETRSLESNEATEPTEQLDESTEPLDESTETVIELNTHEPEPKLIPTPSPKPQRNKHKHIAKIQFQPLYSTAHQYKSNNRMPSSATKAWLAKPAKFVNNRTYQKVFPDTHVNLLDRFYNNNESQNLKHIGYYTW